MERRAFNDQPALSDRPIYCILRRRLIDPEAVVRLMQHDRLQGPAIEGGPRDLRGNSAGDRPTLGWALAFPTWRLRLISDFGWQAGDLGGWRPPFSACRAWDFEGEALMLSA